MGFWSGNEILRRQSQVELISPFKEDNIDCAAYTLTLGGHAFTTTDDGDRSAALSAGKTPGEWNLKEDESVTIQPGQFAFLLTEEIVTIPNDTIAFISVKAGKKLEGLINVSGFHVDPGWSSKLIFGVFNAGSKSLVMRRGERLFLIFFSSLESADDQHSYKEKGRYLRIPAQFIQNMSGAVPSLYKLDKGARELKTELKGLESRLTVVQWVAGIAIAIVVSIVGMIVAKLDFPLQDKESIEQIVSEKIKSIPAQVNKSDLVPSMSEDQQANPRSAPVATDARLSPKVETKKTSE